MHDVGKIAIPDAILQNPGKFKAQPKQPGYIRTPYTTVTFTNQVAKRSDIKGKMHITFPRCLVPLCVGKPEGSYVRTEVKPCWFACDGIA